MIIQMNKDNPQIFVRYWIHNAMLNIGGKKMSKSLGNIFYIRDYLEKYFFLTTQG